MIPSISATRKGAAHVHQLAGQRLVASPYGPAMQGLLSQIATDPVLARVHRQQVVEPRLTQLAPVIQRGIARADLRADTDARLVHDRRSTNRSRRPSKPRRDQD
jgi:Tetracyclin repressor-like, C-terminal domain